MSQLEFDEILRKYLAGKATAEEERLVLRWYSSFIEESETTISSQERNAIEAKIWNRLRNKMDRDMENFHIRKPLIYRGWFKYVAVCLILLVLTKGWLIYRNAHQVDPAVNVFTNIKIPDGYQFTFNNNSNNIYLKLADGSTVELQPKSGLYYPATFNGTTRNVYLAGNAFFNIVHDPSRHFIVHTDEGLATEVLGTSFYVLHNHFHNKDGRIEVNVVTGKVYVYKEEKEQVQNSSSFKKILLTPNQKVDYRASNNQFVIALVEDPKPIQSDIEYAAPTSLTFSYNDALLSGVLKDISETYGVNIEVSNSNLNGCHFTGDISRQSLYEKLDIICEAVQSSYEVKGVAIYIKGIGCN